MSGHPPQRRQVNVGSLLLTPQENECLFNHLGRKCIVSFSIKLYDNRLRKNANAANLDHVCCPETGDKASSEV